MNIRHCGLVEVNDALLREAITSQSIVHMGISQYLAYTLWNRNREKNRLTTKRHGGLPGFEQEQKV